MRFEDATPTQGRERRGPPKLASAWGLPASHVDRSRVHDKPPRPLRAPTRIGPPWRHDGNPATVAPLTAREWTPVADQERPGAGPWGRSSRRASERTSSCWRMRCSTTSGG
ncbi:protein of unknown function [Microbacterium sp. Nx66]|nr:protein of unknown function [Microbacterium sp. Nx66]